MNSSMSGFRPLMALCSVIVVFAWVSRSEDSVLPSLTPMLSSTNSAEACEIIYEVEPHSQAKALFPEGFYEEFPGLDWNEWSEIFVVESRKINQILNASSQLAQGIDLGIPRIDQGGYEGTSSVSIRVPVSVADGQLSGYGLTLASMIGYVYFQDSVLMVCPANEGDTESNVLEYTLIDAGKKDYMNTETAKLLYGMMIGYLNDPGSLGYTYNTTTGTFRVFEFDAVSKKSIKALDYLSQSIEALSNGDVQFQRKQTIVDVQFPHNSWKDYPLGQQYKVNFLIDVDLDVLQSLRIEYIKTVLRVAHESDEH